MIDFVNEYAFAEQATTPLLLPVAFSPSALNRCLWVQVAACHSTNGYSADPMANFGCEYEGEEVVLRRSAFSPNEGFGVIPARAYLYLSQMVTEVPASGTLTVNLRPSALPHNFVVHVVGLKGVLPAGRRDDEVATSLSAALNFLGLIMPAPPFGGFAGAAVKGNPTPPTWATATGLPEQLGDAVAGSGNGSVRGTIWRGDDSGLYSLLGSFGSPAAGTDWSLEGGAATDAVTVAVRMRGGVGGPAGVVGAAGRVAAVGGVGPASFSGAGERLETLVAAHGARAQALAGDSVREAVLLSGPVLAGQAHGGLIQFGWGPFGDGIVPVAFRERIPVRCRVPSAGAQGSAAESVAASIAARDARARGEVQRAE